MRLCGSRVVRGVALLTGTVNGNEKGEQTNLCRMSHRMGWDLMQVGLRSHIEMGFAPMNRVPGMHGACIPRSCRDQCRPGCFALRFAAQVSQAVHGSRGTHCRIPGGGRLLETGALQLVLRVDCRPRIAGLRCAGLFSRAHCRRTSTAGTAIVGGLLGGESHRIGERVGLTR
jgi:hypothetical protein